MKELIEIKKHDTLVQVVCGRELHAKLEINKDYSDWIKVQIIRADLLQDVDFVTYPQKGEDSQSKTRIEYALTIDAAKNIAMLSQTAKGKEVRAYFIECEKQAKSMMTALPKTFSEALRMLADETEAKEAALLQIEHDKPAVAFANIVQDDSNVRCLRIWIKSMKHENNLAVGEREVIAWLVENGYLFRESKGGLLPYSKYEANGKNYFTVSVDEINGQPRRSVKITGKGVVALTGKVVAHFKL